MKNSKVPANIKLLDTSKERMSILKPVTSLDSFDGGNSNTHHPDGLFSAEIFGRAGTEDRDVKFGRIDLPLPILNPFILNKLVKLKGLYKDVIYGKAFAKFDPVLKDLIIANPLEGDTGYGFFIEHLPKIVFSLTESEKREFNVALVNKALSEGTAFINSVPVIPAGLRDIYIDGNGRVSEDEINTRYRSLIAASNAIPPGADPTSPAFNTSRVTLQNAYNAVFDYLWQLYGGKNGFALDRFYSRVVFNGTRNVMTAIDPVSPMLGSVNGPKPNNTVMGLFQVIKGILPVAQYLFLNGWMSTVFNEDTGRALLINPKTLKRGSTAITRKSFDRFRTPDGINGLFNDYFDREQRGSPVMIDDHYVALTYLGVKDSKLVFKIFGDIDELPNDLDRDNVHPTTWVELLYSMGYREFNNYPTTNTRYPVAGLGSDYTSFVYVKTTANGDMRYELDDDWEIKEFHDDNPIKAAYEFPRYDLDKYMETASVSNTRLSGLTLDFDGDTGSQIMLYTQESILENQEMMNKAAFYLNPKGGLMNSALSVETAKRVIQGLAT